MAKYHPPPPTRFGVPPTSQAKRAASFGAIQHLPPPTRYGPAALMQKQVAPIHARLKAPPSLLPSQAKVPAYHRAIQMMESVHTGDARIQQGELVLYPGVILTKTGSADVKNFAAGLATSGLFMEALKQAKQAGRKITLYTGYHGSSEDTASASGMFCERFSDAEITLIENHELSRFVNIVILPPGEKAQKAIELIKETRGNGFVFYAWCYSDALYKSVV